MARYGAFPCTFNAWVANNLDSIQPDSNIDMLVRRGGGELHPSTTGVLRSDNVCAFTSRDVEDVLANASPVNTAKGLVVTSSALQFQLKGTDSSSSSHVIVQSVNGFVYVTDFGATQDSPEGADINFRFKALRSGTTPPFSLLPGQALTGTPTVNTHFKMGPCSLEGTAIRIQGWRLSTGFSYVAKSDSGEVSADQGTIDSEEFTLAIDTDNLALSTWMGDGSAISSGTDVYLRAVGVADNVAAHIKVSVSAGTYTTPSMSVSGQGDATGSIVAQCQVRPTITLNQVIPATAVV